MFCLGFLVETTGEADSLVRRNLSGIEPFLTFFLSFFPPYFHLFILIRRNKFRKEHFIKSYPWEELLPYSLLSSTSTICELRYGDTPKLVAHFKDKGSGDTSKTVLLNKPSEASEQSYLQQISEFVHLKTNREKGSDYEKIELFWPHNLLKVRHEQAQ